MATRRSRIKPILNIRKIECRSNEEPPKVQTPQTPANPVEQQSKQIVEETADKPEETVSKLEETVVKPEEAVDKPEEIVSKPVETVDKPEETVDKPKATISKPIVRKLRWVVPKLSKNALERSKIKEVTETRPPLISSLVEEAVQTNLNLDLPVLPETNHELSETESQLTGEQPSDVADATSSLIQDPKIKTFKCRFKPAVSQRLLAKSKEQTEDLRQRKISASFYGSASESEDEHNKRRIRTESTCSVNVQQDTIKTDEKETLEKPIVRKVFNPRKCKRSEQSRRIAEARRNFVIRFGKGVPDKQKLTMMDLIYYNPATEPMSIKPTKNPSDFPPINLDEPAASNEEEDADEVPAPQIKIGTDGEIVVDEKSLIIENVQTRKSREELQKSSLIDGDFETGYGVFKRAKRTREWSHAETLHFYKALNTLGTDFSMMEKFFNDRTRRDLKLKFKKEEKINLGLVNKALMSEPICDMDELKMDCDKQKVMMELEKEAKTVDKKKEKSMRRNRCKRDKAPSIPVKKKDLYSRLEKGGLSLCQSSSEHESLPEPPAPVRKKRRRLTSRRQQETKEDETPTEISNIIKQTRSGRVPKRTHKEINVNEAVLQETSKMKNNLEPGSIMIVNCTNPDGTPSVQIFMVTDKCNRVPITVSDDVVKSLTESANTETLADS